MKITAVRSHVLQTDMLEELGYSQQFYAKRTCHLVEVQTDEGVTGWGECFGPGNVALANKGIVERVIAPMVLGDDPLDRDVLWHRVYNLLRDHGQKGMPMQALSGVDIALWDIAGQEAGWPAEPHAPAFQFAHDNFLKKTVHAGEAYGPESIFQAITALHADRLGHGYHLFSPTLIQSEEVQEPERYVERLAQYIAMVPAERMMFG